MLNQTAAQLSVSVRFNAFVCASTLCEIFQSRVQQVLVNANATFDQLNGPNGTQLVLNVRLFLQTVQLCVTVTADPSGV